MTIRPETEARIRQAVQSELHTMGWSDGVLEADVAEERAVDEKAIEEAIREVVAPLEEEISRLNASVCSLEEQLFDSEQ